MTSASPAFASPVVDRVRRSGNVWQLPGGELRLPRVFGFCRGVTRALAMLEQALETPARGRFFLLGQIIHNPYVNDYFQGRGVVILSQQQRRELENCLTPDDCGVIPAFGVPLEAEQRLQKVGCRVLDTTCGDVRRLWAWVNRAAGEGYGVLIFGRAQHDETIVTRSRLEAVGGKYLVVGSVEEARRFCDLIVSRQGHGNLGELFGPQATNAAPLSAFERLAQVSQTTMLYDDTMRLRDVVRSAFERRFGVDAPRRLLFQPTVCHATQQRQTAARELCQGGCDLNLVVGGFGSSNTTHLYELARDYAPALFIEDAEAIMGAERIRAYDPARSSPAELSDWLPRRRPLTIGVLAGASSPEIVIGQVLERLAALLS